MPLALATTSQPRRPQRWRLDPRAPAAQGLVFAALGANAGTARYEDSGPYGLHGTLNGWAGGDFNLNEPRYRYGGIDPEIGRLTLSVPTTSAFVALPTIPTTTNWAISLWFNAESSAVSSYFFDSSNGGTRTAFMYGSDDGTLGYYDGSYHRFGAQPSLFAWHHICLINNGSTVRLLLDGVPYGSTLSATAVALGPTPTIGNRYAAPQTFWFPGRIADFLVFSPAPPDEVIRALADPTNADLSVGRGAPLLQPVRRFRPAGMPVQPSSYPASVLCHL